MELPADPTAGRYLEQLSDRDLGVLGAACGLIDRTGPGNDGPGKDVAEHLRAHPELVVQGLADPATFEHVFGPHSAAGLAEVSPYLLFAVAVHRGVFDLQSASFVAEPFGGHKRIPVFDTASLRQYYTDPFHRLFAVEHLASYTRVQSGPVWVRHGQRWRRQRYSELEPQRLAGLLDAVAEEERPGIFRRLGDLALLLTGVFPDHSATHPLSPIETERLVRSLTLVPPGALAGAAITAQEGAALIFECGRSRAALLGVLGPRWYSAAAATSPLTSTQALLNDAAEGFDVARRFLNLLTDRYLFPLRSGFFGVAAG